MQIFMIIGQWVPEISERTNTHTNYFSNIDVIRMYLKIEEKLGLSPQKKANKVS